MIRWGELSDGRVGETTASRPGPLCGASLADTGVAPKNVALGVTGRLGIVYETAMESDEAFQTRHRMVDAQTDGGGE